MRQLLLASATTIFMCLASCTNKKQTLFKMIPSSTSGIHFTNTITENDSINPMDVVNIYNGGGVGIGDFNNDGLPDVYFTGNMVASKLYINKRGFKFEDVTDKAGVEGMGRWARGVSIVDINNDGLSDIYVCNTIYNDSLRRRNILYVNQGAGANGIPTFKDMAADYGLEAGLQSTMGSFFDYDNDGDLDMYLTVNEASSGYSSSVFNTRNSNVKTSQGRLFRNDRDSLKNHGVYHDVSTEAGITLAGFGHAATICDINLDGWKDIYVSDDFISSNILYINNHDGTFSNQSKNYFKHTSFNAMGQDVVDINNDGLADVVELDMNPKDNHRKKMMLSSNNYNTIQNFDKFGYQHQYVRNTLQLNQGNRIENDSIGAPAFSEIGFLSGMSQTDWSWTPVITDFDNDGFRDMVITNGFPRDVSDHDFIAYRQKANGLQTPMSMMEMIPMIKLSDFAFKNKNGIQFDDVSKDWGINTLSFSSGAVYADLDNDGDMDMLVSNINAEPAVYENTLRTKSDTANRYLQIIFKGNKQNINGFGAFATIYYDGGKQQVYEHNPYRGYLSSNQTIAHFGLGTVSNIDSVVIRWPGLVKQTIKNVKPNQQIKADIADATEHYSFPLKQVTAESIFTEVTNSLGVTYTHQDFDFIDFNIQTILPHKFSQYSPALAAGDLNGDGLDDIVAGGNNIYKAKVLLQKPDGKFTERLLDTLNDKVGYTFRDEGILIFDANADGHPDVYVASGSFNYSANDPSYQDRLYINNGKGFFTQDSSALPKNYTSKLCVRAFDFNNDGKLDVFASGRVYPGKYPKPVSSIILRNDSENGHAKFTDATKEIAPDLINIGMVCDALFTDFDNDKNIDLVLAGEWMPVTFLKNTGGKFKNISASSGINEKFGWWNSIMAGDFRHTGLTDYIVGNSGMNVLYQPDSIHPVYVTAKDFDNNGSYVPVTSLFLPSIDGSLKEFPAFGRDDIIERIPTLKKRFSEYGKFADATMQDIFTPEMLKGAERLKVNTLKSCYLRNEGNGRFTMIPLPLEAQFSILNGMNVDDYNGDGNADLLLNGNDFGIEVSIGRMDALNGLLLLGDGKGNFQPKTIAESGIYIPGDGKALINLKTANGQYLVAASQNKGPLKLFRLNQQKRFIDLNNDDQYAVLTYKNGMTQKVEFYFGSGFISQSSRHCVIGENVMKVEIRNAKGLSRVVNDFQELVSSSK